MDELERDGEPQFVVHDETHLFSRDILPVVPVVPFHRATISYPRGHGKKSMSEAFEDFGEAWVKLAEELAKVAATVPLVQFARERLNTWAEPPPDVMERALQARKNRNTGPARPSAQAARRPRRHK